MTVHAVRCHRPAVVLATLALLVLGCAGLPSGRTPPAETAATGPSPAPDALRVVTTTTVLGDLVRQVGGEHVEVHSLVPVGGEVHTFDPTPSDATRTADAELLVMNGLGLDNWLAALAAEARASGIPAVALAEDLEGVDYLAGDEHGQEAEEDEHPDENANPHLWLNAAYAIKYVERLTETLVEVDQAQADSYRAHSADYTAELAELHAWVGEQIEQIPVSRRRVISFHEAFPYFADAYGLQIVGTVIDAPGQEPSAGEVSRLIDAIRREGAVAIFSEAQFPTAAAERISEETGVEIVATLYNDSLGDSPADSYVGMMRWNVEQIVSALR